MKLLMPKLTVAISKIRYHFPHIPIHKGTVFPSVTTDYSNLKISSLKSYHSMNQISFILRHTFHDCKKIPIFLTYVKLLNLQN